MSLCSNVACKGVLGLLKSVVVSEGLVASRLEVVSPDESGIFTVPTGKPPHSGEKRAKVRENPRLRFKEQVSVYLTLLI